MIGQQFPIERIHRRCNRRGLYQNIRTLGASLHHTADAANLSFDAVEPMNEAFVFFLGTLFCFFTAAIFVFHLSYLTELIYPLGVP